MLDLAIFLGRLAGAMLDPIVIVIALLGAFLPALKNAWQRIVFVAAATAIGAVVLYSLGSYLTASEKTVGVTFGVIGGLVWLGIILSSRRFLSARRRAAYEAKPDPFYEKHRG